MGFAGSQFALMVQGCELCAHPALVPCSAPKYVQFVLLVRLLGVQVHLCEVVCCVLHKSELPHLTGAGSN